jgi:hypothetical protein
MHVIPAFGLLAARLLSPHRGTGAVALFSVLYVAIVGFVFVEAVLGRPLLPA